MNKPEVGKGATDTRKAPNSNGTGTNGASKPVNGKSQTQMSASRNAGVKNAASKPTVPVSTAKKTGTTGVRPKAKKGFRIRPLDIGLIIAGILVVGFIILSATQVRPTAISSGAGVPGDATHVPVGQAAPDFTVQDVDGKDYTLSSFKGSPVVLEFMATWCPHCQAEAPNYTKLNDNYASKGVKVLGINATPYGHNYETSQGTDTSPATTDDLKWFKSTYNTSYTLLFDKTLKSATEYGVLAFPSVYIVDKNGTVAYQPPDSALPTYDELTAKLDELLK